MLKKMLLLPYSNNDRFEKEVSCEFWLISQKIYVSCDKMNAFFSQEQARTLEKLDNSQIGIKCNVTLTKSEEELFGRSGKTDANVCSTLIHELKAQKLDLNNMLNCWMEFTEKVEEFSSVETDIRNKVRKLRTQINLLLGY